MRLKISLRGKGVRYAVQDRRHDAIPASYRCLASAPRTVIWKIQYSIRVFRRQGAATETREDRCNGQLADAGSFRQLSR
jgi:hypothetical protein